MQLQRFAAIEKVQIPFDFRISAYLQTADKFELQNLAREAPLIGRRKLRCKIGDALLAALFDRFKLFATSGETVTTQLSTSQHIRHAIAKRFRRTADAIKDLFRPRVQSSFSFAINPRCVIDQQHVTAQRKRFQQPFAIALMSPRVTTVFNWRQPMILLQPFGCIGAMNCAIDRSFQSIQRVFAFGVDEISGHANKRDIKRYQDAQLKNTPRLAFDYKSCFLHDEIPGP
jgi:flavin-binding protein dodecin